MLGVIDYRWWKLLHVLGVLGFVLFHGVSMMVAIRLRKERDRTRIAELLQFSGSAVQGMYGALLMLVVFGVVAGFSGHFWSYWWIWIAIALLVITAVEMGMVARPYYRRLKDAIQLRPSGVPRTSDEELVELLRSRLALFNTVWGVVALVVIAWLMIWKPTWHL